ncbi:MAG: DUF4301 family protein [Bacteroidales bacterium]|nr:DUF4301 family protein [Bacteroidales bacterium]
MWTEKDLILFKEKGLSIQDVEKQIQIFKHGFNYTTLVRPATIDDGIIHLSYNEVEKLVKYFDDNKDKYSLIKFVPASGAATRMFKEFYEFLNSNKPLSEYPKVNNFIKTFKNTHFYKLLKQKNIDPDNLEPKELINYILKPNGLNYGNLPKALIHFHDYNYEIRTAFEEHIVEAINYLKNKTNIVKIHFTITPEHYTSFTNIEKQVVPKYNEKGKIIIEYSEQKPFTDTISVTLENEPFRNSDGTLLFRPGGHGALIYNLNNLEEDIIFIKNIDNVCPDKLKDDTIKYKKVLGAFLMKIIENIFFFQKKIDNSEIDDTLILQIKNFYKENFHISISNKIEEIKELLFRPIRVCGMVRNTGEPGGGPFWVIDGKNNVSLQIVELSQININDPKQNEIAFKATHFNPVDIVCCIKNYKGEKYNLKEFIDHNTCFISEKSKDGKPLKALELPGLWNGSMAYWNTIFVEVPLSTFNPVKTIFDLLKENHL